MAELLTINMAAKKSAVASSKPKSSAPKRAMVRVPSAVTTTARTTPNPISFSFRNLSLKPIKNIKKTSPNCANNWIRAGSVT